MTDTVTLVVRRVIRAHVERVFEAWTNPTHLRAWWGPRPVTCSGAEVDLRVGGRYRICNGLPNGSTVIIEGEFREIHPPRRLVYTWTMGNEGGASLVSVRFEERGTNTEVVIVHEHLPTSAVRDSHEQGWSGCLNGLEDYLA